MQRTKKVLSALFLGGLCSLCFSVEKSYALELRENLTLEGNVAWVHQWLEKKKGDFKDKDRGAGAIDVTLNYKATEKDEFAIRGAFAKERGIKKVNPFALSPVAIDFSEDLHNINGRSRDHIKELWYARTFELPGNSTLKTTLGIIDSASFIDENRFANDEYTQFLNEVFVNNPIANLVSYDYGMALEWDKKPFSIKLVGMQSKTEEEKKNYNYYALQLGYNWEVSLGEGNLRLYGFTTNSKFLNWDETKKKSLKGFGISFDQDLIKERLGLFVRMGVQDDKAKDATYKNMYSFGLNSKFCVWPNKELTIGIGYSYLKAPSKNEDLKNSKVFETYVALPLYEIKEKFVSTLTFDYQFMKDSLKDEEVSSQKGDIWGIRFNISSKRRVFPKLF